MSALLHGRLLSRSLVYPLRARLFHSSSALLLPHRKLLQPLDPALHRPQPRPHPLQYPPQLQHFVLPDPLQLRKRAGTTMNRVTGELLARQRPGCAGALIVRPRKGKSQQLDQQLLPEHKEHLREPVMRSTPASDALCHLFFPSAVVNLAMLDMLDALAKKLGLNDQNTLFAHSTCPDEINHNKGRITRAMRL